LILGDVLAKSMGLSAVKAMLCARIGRTELQKFQGNCAGLEKELAQTDFTTVIHSVVLI